MNVKCGMTFLGKVGTVKAKEISLAIKISPKIKNKNKLFFVDTIKEDILNTDY